jgi:YVTN family beta-propeller protein
MQNTLAIGMFCTLLSANAAWSQSQRIEQGGIAVELITQVQFAEKDQTSATLDFVISDVAKGTPYRGLTPRAWLTRDKKPELLSNAECKSSIQSFVQGGLANQPEVDLNGFRLALLNDDASVSIINPAVSLGGSQLEHLVTLPAPGSEMLVHEQLLYLSIPQKDLVEVIDTISGRVERSIQLPADSKPGRIARDPRTGTIWISLDNSNAVVAIRNNRDKPAFVKVGTGLHRFAFPNHGRDVYVSSSGADLVTIIDGDALNTVTSIATGQTPVELSYGEAGKQILVANYNSDFISVIDTKMRKVRPSIVVTRKITDIAFEPDGRFAVALDNAKGAISLIDSASNRVTASLAAAKMPDHASFSRNYLYVHDLDQAAFMVFSLAELHQGKLTPIKIETGNKPPSKTVVALASDVIAVAPDGSSAFIANPSENELFYYAEGMMVPMGTLNAYGKKIMGIAVLNRGLTEKQPGHYSVKVSLDSGGSFNLPLLVDQPRLMHCFHVELGKSSMKVAERAGSGLYVEAKLPAQALVAGTHASVSFRIRERATGADVTNLLDAEVLAHGPSAKWFGRSKIKELKTGIYAANWTFPVAGQYQVFFSIPSRRVKWTSLDPVSFEVKEATP